LVTGDNDVYAGCPVAATTAGLLVRAEAQNAFLADR